MDTKLMFVGEAWGEQEEKIRKAMVGPTGIELFRLCHEAQLIEMPAQAWSLISDYYKTYDPDCIDEIWQMYPQIHRTNVLNRRPPYNKLLAFCAGKAEGVRGYPAIMKGKYLHYSFQEELDRLADELDAHNPNLVVALGNTAMWALLGQTAISKNRGTTSISSHTISGFKTLPTYHPAAIFQQFKYRPVVVMDLAKAARECEYPEIRRPAREIWIEPTLEDLEEFYARHICSAPLVSVDIETSGKLITTIGFSPRPDIALVVPFFDPRKKGRSYWPTAKDEVGAKLFVRKVLEDPSLPKLFQNGLYDIAFIWRTWGIRILGAQEDTMLIHHALQPESLKGLGFLGSVYTDEGSWKQLNQDVDTIKRDD